ncbi:hypothetical protein BpHYR1_026013 [Brachionus plicatilis]|uniref:Uncharacterized protein n=1 Tax=Brachionus plicatilis TaxID=10195 RepID=A0A3M7RIM5_BRAPC|nr:hypothetical protein BpHYR1_026013 [Brachionus plicatilis]
MVDSMWELGTNLTSFMLLEDSKIEWVKIIYDYACKYFVNIIVDQKMPKNVFVESILKLVINSKYHFNSKGICS